MRVARYSNFCNKTKPDQRRGELSPSEENTTVFFRSPPDGRRVFPMALTDKQPTEN